MGCVYREAIAHCTSLGVNTKLPMSHKSIFRIIEKYCSPLNC